MGHCNKCHRNEKDDKRLLQTTALRQTGNRALDEFLETHTDHNRVTHNDRATRKEAESVIEILSTNKSSGPHGFAREFHHTFKKELTLILLKCFQKFEEEETLPSSC